jgi:predicted transcriptional regulator
MEKLRSYFAKSQHLRLSETQSKVKQARAISSETANLDLKNHSKIHIIDAPVVEFLQQ